ncbi:MAG TPA: hypothetical protein VF599_04200 [Pyrinomonadaceae bacterium]
MEEKAEVTSFEEFCEIKRQMALDGVPEKDRNALLEAMEGKPVEIHLETRFGEAYFRFTPKPAEEMLLDDARRQAFGKDNVVYQTNEITNEELYKKYDEIIEKADFSTPETASKVAEEAVEFIRQRAKQKSSSFIEPILDLRKSYFATQKSIELFPKFIRQIVESIDVKDIKETLDSIEARAYEYSPEELQVVVQSKKNLVENFYTKYSNDKLLKELIGKKHGGSRLRTKPYWSKENLIEFFKAVESIPKIKGELAWEYVAKMVMTMGSSDRTFKWLLGDDTLATFPPKLLAEAVQVFGKYRGGISTIKKDQHKPQFFGYRHALFLLNYPDIYKFGTLYNKYYEGGKLHREKQFSS